MKCPGQDTRYWKPGDIFDVDCPYCGNSVEFFKDEAARQCGNCRKKIVNPRMNFGCAAYCQFAEQCLGDLGPDLLAKRDDLLKDRLAIEVKKLLGRDFKNIAHIISTASYAEKIAREEKAEPSFVVCAAYLHVFFESREEQTLLSEQQSARDILDRLGASPTLILETLGIIDRFITGQLEDAPEVRVLHDAHLLALHGDKKGESGEKQTEIAIIQKQCLTDTAKRLVVRSGETTSD